MSLSPTPFAIVLLLAALPALAYETDQLTHRDRLLVDARGPANQEVNRQLSLAVAHTNDRLGCDASAESTRRHLATEIHRLLARPTSAPDRGSFDSMGFGAYGAFLERAPIARRDFVDHSDIYGGLKPAQSFILASVGVCSTIRLAGVLMGTDKLDHFFGQGYDYLRKSHWGRFPIRATTWGTSTELGGFGLLTSNVFSFADLHANRRGFAFYDGLLSEESGIRIGDSGCVEIVHPFDWVDWVDDAYDEVLNPSIYGQHVSISVARRKEENRSSLCAAYQRWGKAARARRSRVAKLVVGDTGSNAPPRPTEMDLDRFCRK